MSFNTVGAQQVALELFGGLVTDMPAMNLPAGVSPDCQDMAFQPGSVFTRPGLTKVLATPLGGVTITYNKSYVANDGTIRNLYLDSAGNFWTENITAATSPVLTATVTPGSYAKSITAFGREYIAISDGIHGTEVALQFDGTNLDRITQDGPGTSPTIANLIIPPVNLSAAPHSLDRASNVVTATTAAAHGLQVGYLAQISGVTAQAIGFVNTIVINNEDNPGIATITMATPHGLSPGVFVSIANPPATAVGGGVSSAKLVGDVLTIVTSAPSNLEAGAIVTLTLTGGTASTALAVPFTATLSVASINNPTEFVCSLPNSNSVNATASGGTVSVEWPASGNPETTFWEVLECPSSTVFTVAITYTDGTWTGSMTGVTEPWDGTFYVASVPSATTFTYFSKGPDGNSTVVGLMTPTGQAAPGEHQMQVLFLTRQDYITKPSPPVKFIANGGQYLHITNIPIGPANVVARILAFTGTDGAYFFYIPVPAQVNGQIVSTATQINDNSTTSITLDFGDATLFSSTGISKQGNNLAGQIILDGALGFAFFGDRLVTYGQRNTVQNLLNMGFDGGIIGAQITGWTGTGTLVSASTTHHFSAAVSAPALSQSFYQDYSGAAIGEPNQTYRARAWMSGGGCTVTISSASTGFTSTATLTPGAGGWGEAAFSLAMPATIPSDMILTLASGQIVDDLSIIFADAPFLNQGLYGSYVNNPEAFNGVTGKFGVEDTRKIMTTGIIRGTMAVLTQDPAGRLHVIQNNGVTEPAGWSVNEVAASCGAMSTFCMTVSQADDATAGGGEEWMAWISYSGARIFGGDQPWKISQEIQPNWDGINTGAWLTTWALNDPSSRRIYFGLPKGVIKGTNTLATAPNVCYHVDYKELDGAYQIAEASPIHMSLQGKLLARDHARKWCPWVFSANGAALVYRNPGGPLYTVFFAGNGAFPGTVGGGCGNVFAPCSGATTDDCFGSLSPYYTTYAFTSVETEESRQLGGQRHLLQFLQWNARGTGNLQVTPLIDTLSNPWPITATVPLRADPTYDDEWGGGQASGQRIFFKFQPM